MLYFPIYTTKKTQCVCVCVCVSVFPAMHFAPLQPIGPKLGTGVGGECPMPQKNFITPSIKGQRLL